MLILLYIPCIKFIKKKKLTIRGIIYIKLITYILLNYFLLLKFLNIIIFARSINSFLFNSD